MKKNPYFINILLVAVTFLAYLVGMLVQTFSPATILPRIGIPFLVILSLIALVIEHYLVGEKQRERIGAIVLAGATFTALPICAGWEIGMPIWKLFAAGAIVFGVVDMFYEGIGEKMSSGPHGKFSPIANAVLLFLASQCFQGLL